MKATQRLLYFLCFVGLAAAAALALNRIVEPSMSSLLLRAVVAAAIAGAPGLIHRKAWPAALVLLPLGAYLLLRTTLPVPPDLGGISGQYHFYLEQLSAGGSAYVSKFFPLDLADAPELTLLLAVSVYWLVGVAAFLALSLRRALPAVVLTLVLLAFSLTVDTASRVVWLALLFLVLAACLLVLSRGIKRQGWRFRDAVAGGAVGVVAAFLALALLGAAPSAAAAPWQNWRQWDPFRPGGSVYSINWQKNLGDLLDPANNAPIMRVHSSAESYWRANALDRFTGTAWVSSQPFRPGIDKEQIGATYSYSVPAAGPRPSGKTVTETFQVHGVLTNYFFVGGDPETLTIARDLALGLNDMRSLHVAKPLGPDLEYSVTAVVPELKPADLVGLGASYPESVRRYLNLPFSNVAEISGPDKAATWKALMTDSGPEGLEWVGLYELNQRIVAEATDPYEITLNIERYLRLSFEYSLTPPPTQYSSFYAAFLFDTHSGYCQHFAGTMAMLLRYNSIPARVAVGFVTGEKDGEGEYVVSTNNAHAWVEVYFPELGWAAFDPTPGRSLPNATSYSNPGFINPFVDPSDPGSGEVAPEPPPTRPPDGTQNAGGQATQTGAGWLGRAPWLPWLLGLVVVLTGWPTTRALLRRRSLRRGPLEQRLQASLTLLRAGLSGLGAPAPASFTLEETAEFLRAHLGIESDPSLIDRTDAITFGGHEATQGDLQNMEALRRELQTRLRRRRGWVKTALAWYVVPRPASAKGVTG